VTHLIYKAITIVCVFTKCVILKCVKFGFYFYQDSAKVQGLSMMLDVQHSFDLCNNGLFMDVGRKKMWT
jgi:hypothetical protein